MTNPTFDTINVGDALPSLVKPPITEVQLVRYSGASGDFNPIHTVHQAGVDSGNNGVITHGMVIMGFVGQMITNWVRPTRCASSACALPASAGRAIRSPSPAR